MAEPWTRAFAPISSLDPKNNGTAPSLGAVPEPRPQKQRYGCSLVCFVWKHNGPAENDEVCKISAVKSTLEDLADVDVP